MVDRLLLAEAVRLDGQRGLPVKCRALGGHFGERVVNKPVNHLACLVDAVFQEGRADERFHDVA